MKKLIINGTVVDGTGKPGYKANVLVEDDKIAAIGDIQPAEGMEVIDAAGLVVAPGFIDTHSHSDLKILEEPEVAPKVMQGITTEILGQDGISMAPLPVEYISPWRKNLAGLDGDSDNINWEFKNTEGYLAMIDAVKPGLNECYLVPHGNIRMEAMGLENRQPNEEELEKMRQITRREMEAGAVGLSTGLIYMPCAYSESKEIIEMCKVVAEYDGIFVIHQRSEADTILDSMEEVIRIGRESGVKIHYSHSQGLRQEELGQDRQGHRAAGKGRGRGHPGQLRPVPLRGRQHHAGRYPAALGARRRHQQGDRASA